MLPSLVSSNILSNISISLPFSFFPGNHPAKTLLARELCCNICSAQVFVCVGLHTMTVDACIRCQHCGDMNFLFFIVLVYCAAEADGREITGVSSQSWNCGRHESTKLS